MSGKCNIGHNILISVAYFCTLCELGGGLGENNASRSAKRVCGCISPFVLVVLVKHGLRGHTNSQLFNENIVSFKSDTLKIVIDAICPTLSRQCSRIVQNVQPTFFHSSAISRKLTSKVNIRIQQYSMYLL